MGVSTAGAVILNLVGDIGAVLSHPVDDAGTTLASGLGVAAGPVHRKVLALLSERSKTTAEELAREAVDDEDVPFRSADQLALVLHHRCLPKLEDENYVRYDPDSGTVVRRGDSGSVPAEPDSG